MSRPIWSAGIASAATVVGGRVGLELRCHHDVGRAARSRRRCSAERSRYSRQVVDLVLLEQALADLVALGREEGEDHAAADQQLCRPCRAGCRSRPSLSLTLEPPSTTT